MAHEKPFSKRGEIWLVDFSPSIGSEIQDLHPALVVSVDELNKSTWGLIVVCPNPNKSENTKSEAQNLRVNPVRVLNPDRVSLCIFLLKISKLFLKDTITTFRKNKPFRLHILISPPEGGIR